MKTQGKPKRPKKPADVRGAQPERREPADWTWADPNSLEVNPEFQRLIPLQSRGEYRALSQSVKEEGCRDPLLVWKGRNVVLDGHTRRDLCIEYEKMVKIREVELPDEKAAADFSLRIQRQRRNLTREAMSYFRGTEYNTVKGRHGGRQVLRKAKGQFDQTPTTAQRLASQYGVAEKTIRRDAVFAKAIDKIVADYGDSEVKRQLLGADVKLTQGMARSLYRMPTEERNRAVKQLVELGESPAAKRGKSSSAREPKQVAQVLVARLKAKGNEHALAVLDQMARLLGKKVSE